MEYQHGGDIYSQEILLDYSANINPLGMPKGVREELKRCMDSHICSVYPDSRCRELRAALGKHHGLPEQWIICGNGAADLIFGLTAALRPKRGLVTAPSFSEYEQAMETAGCQADHFFLKEEEGFIPDVERMGRHIQRMFREGNAYDMVFLCNPNNPTGIPVKRDQVEELARICGETGAVLVVDECFCDFMDVPEDYSILPSLDHLSHVFVLKAFTKVYAMAGLRLGYGICSHESLLEDLQRVRQPWSVSGLAQRAGVCALGERGYVELTREVLGRERQWMSQTLKGLGFKVYPSRANYLLFRDTGERRGWEEKSMDGAETGLETGQKTGQKTGSDKGWLYSRLLARRVLIRSCANYPGLDASFYRVCVKLREDNERLAEQIRQVLAEGGRVLA